MPAESCRTMPARSKSLCETTSASAGSSRRVGTKYCDQRIVFCRLNSWKSVKPHSRLAQQLRQTRRDGSAARCAERLRLSVELIGSGGYASKLKGGVASRCLEGWRPV